MSHERRHVEEAEDSQACPQSVYTTAALDPVYHAKAKILNDAFEEIGMGTYQWQLFVVVGLGYSSDELWLFTVALIYTPVTREFNVQGEWMVLAQSLGLLVGAVFWGIACDVWSRRWTFHFALLCTVIFAIVAAAAPNYTFLCACIAMWSFGVGGSYPADNVIFLDFIPPSHQYLLTVLGMWWSVGDLVGSLLAWPLISNFSCPPIPAPCPTSSNKGWRYFLLTAGGIVMVMWIIRFFVFNIQESPKCLVSHGKDENAVSVVHRVAKINGAKSNLTVEQLKEAGMIAEDYNAQMAVSATTMSKISKFYASHVKTPFATRKLAYSTSILTVSGALIGLGFTSYYTFQTYYLQTRGVADEDSSPSGAYRKQVVSSYLGVSAALFAGYLVEHPALGRRRTFAIFTVLTALFIPLSMTARTSNAVHGWNCAINYVSNIMFAVRYATIMELLPTRARGTGSAIIAVAFQASTAIAPAISLSTNINSPVVGWVSGAVLIPAGLIGLLLPIEPLGRGSVEI